MGRPVDAVQIGGEWARRGIVARGVLLDLERTAPAPYSPGSAHAFSVETWSGPR